jgi:hypothetical protein
MQGDQIPDSEKMISRNPYDESSDEDEDSPLPTVATLLKQLKLLSWSECEKHITSSL